MSVWSESIVKCMDKEPLGFVSVFISIRRLNRLRFQMITHKGCDKAFAHGETLESSFSTSTQRHWWFASVEFGKRFCFHRVSSLGSGCWFARQIFTDRFDAFENTTKANWNSGPLSEESKTVLECMKGRKSELSLRCWGPCSSLTIRSWIVWFECGISPSQMSGWRSVWTTSNGTRTSSRPPRPSTSSSSVYLARGSSWPPPPTGESCVHNVCEMDSSQKGMVDQNISFDWTCAGSFASFQWPKRSPKATISCFQMGQGQICALPKSVHTWCSSLGTLHNRQQCEYLSFFFGIVKVFLSCSWW